MKIAIKLFFIFLTLGVFQNSLMAQNNANFFNDSTQRVSVSLGANFSYASSVMNNQFINKFIFGGKIERKDKDNAYNNLSDYNRLGGDINYHLNIEIPIDTFFKKTTVSLFFGVENLEHVDARFSSDLFKLTFDGNKQFAGQQANIDKTSFNYYKYQKFNFGLINYKFFKDKVAKEGVILSLIKGQEHNAVNINEGSIFTEQFGREVEVDLDYLYHSSDTLNKGFSAFNGWGVSADLFTEYFLKNGDKIYLGLEDLGFVSWNSNSLEIAADSTFYFDGVEVDNIFDLNDSLVSGISRDSIIDNLSSTNKKTTYTIATTAAFNINYTKYFNKKWKVNIGIYHKILANYSPLFSVNGYYYVNNKMAVKGHVSYGGYGKFNTGLALSKSVKNYFNIFIGTNNLNAFVAPKSSFGNSGFVGLKAYF